MLGCGHSGCQVCIQELLNNSNAHSRCPMCRADFEREDIRPNVALAKLTSELQVHCQSLDCGRFGKYGNAALHYQSCPKVAMQCQHVSYTRFTDNLMNLFVATVISVSL